MLNRPTIFNDPTGNVSCSANNYDDGPQCKSFLTSSNFKSLIKKRFGINMTGSWSSLNAETMYEALLSINTKMHGHLREYTSGVTFSFSHDPKHYGGVTQPNGNIDFHSYSAIPIQNIYHEVGHSINNVGGNFFTNLLSNRSVYTANSDYVMGGPPYNRNSLGYEKDTLLDPNFDQEIEAQQHSNSTHCDRPGWCEAGNTADEEWADLFANYVAGNFTVDPSKTNFQYGIVRQNWVSAAFYLYNNQSVR